MKWHLFAGEDDTGRSGGGGRRGVVVLSGGVDGRRRRRQRQQRHVVAVGFARVEELTQVVRQRLGRREPFVHQEENVGEVGGRLHYAPFVICQFVDFLIEFF